MSWDVIYKKAIYPDGTLLFPQRLTKEFLETQRRVLGSYFFANQYLNEVIPDEERKFKKEWIRTYETIPTNTYRFAFVDPAIGQEKGHDYTAIVLIDVDVDGNWYVRLANRYRITPTQIVQKVFDLQERFKCMAIGVEIVAYQEALLYIMSEEMQRRQSVLPVKGIRRNAVSKESRILGLVPRFEWGKIFMSQGLTDFEDEYFNFPRGTHDDILDALSSLEELVFYPQREVNKLERPNSPNHPDYERWYIQNKLGGSKHSASDDPFNS